MSVITSVNALDLRAPTHPLGRESLEVVSREQLPYIFWTNCGFHRSEHYVLQSVLQIWESNKIAVQNLVYGKQEFETDGTAKPFAGWEVIPYEEKSGIFASISRIWQQCVVYFHILFGASEASKEELLEKVERYKKWHSNLLFLENVRASHQKGSDAFCKSEVIEKQWVVKGSAVDVLLNYKPIGLGGERIHLLVVPHAHKDFKDVTKEEYEEAAELTTEITKLLVDKRKNTEKAIHNVYMHHKTGADAGQTELNHWHMQVIMTQNGTQDFFSKVKVLWNILFGSSKLSDAELKVRVEALREELKTLSLY